MPPRQDPSGDMYASEPVPSALQHVSQTVLENYVGSRIRRFARDFVANLNLRLDEGVLDAAFTQAMAQSAVALPAHGAQGEEGPLHMRLFHKCRYLGCVAKNCLVCKNNPYKQCPEDDNLAECYADNQVLKAKCDADVYLAVCGDNEDVPVGIPGAEVQLSVIDGEAYNETNAGATTHELLRADEGHILLQGHGHRADASGRVCVPLPEDGLLKLPDLHVTDKSDTFHMHGRTFPCFRLLARVVVRDRQGLPVPLAHVAPAVSQKFVVKTQRALNDYSKTDYPHYRDDLTKLRYIGTITAQRLRDVRAHLGPDVPFTSIDTVEQLKQLLFYADANRHVENKMLELLNMKGKHKHKWDYLREVLSERIVYDDTLYRSWFADASQLQGLLFGCKQGQVNIEKPIGLLTRALSVPPGAPRLQVSTSPDAAQMQLMKSWLTMAEAAWVEPGHPGWSIVNEPIEVAPGSAALPASGMPGLPAPILAVPSPKAGGAGGSTPGGEGAASTRGRRRSSAAGGNLSRGGSGGGAAPGAGGPGQQGTMMVDISGGLQEVILMPQGSGMYVQMAGASAPPPQGMRLSGAGSLSLSHDSSTSSMMDASGLGGRKVLRVRRSSSGAIEAAAPGGSLPLLPEGSLAERMAAAGGQLPGGGGAQHKRQLAEAAELADQAAALDGMDPDDGAAGGHTSQVLMFDSSYDSFERRPKRRSSLMGHSASAEPAEGAGAQDVGSLGLPMLAETDVLLQQLMDGYGGGGLSHVPLEASASPPPPHPATMMVPGAVAHVSLVAAPPGAQAQATLPMQAELQRNLKDMLSLEETRSRDGAAAAAAAGAFTGSDSVSFLPYKRSDTDSFRRMLMPLFGGSASGHVGMAEWDEMQLGENSPSAGSGRSGSGRSQEMTMR